MTIDTIKIFFRFLVLVLVQVLILNHIEFSGFINPMLYVMFLLMLPFETAEWMLLILGFLTGITIDYFNDTMGMHAAACVFMMFARPRVLKLFSPREGYESGAKPTVESLGPLWFFYYSGILVVLHHFVLFYLEVFRFSEFFYTFFKVVLSSVCTIIVIFIAQYLIYKKRNRIN